MSREAAPAGHPSAGSPPAIGRPTIAVVGGKLKIVRKAHELGLGVVYIQRPDQFDHTHWPYVDQALLVDYTDTAGLLPLARSLHQAYAFQSVVSLTELGLRPAAEIDQMLGLEQAPLGEDADRPLSTQLSRLRAAFGPDGD